MAKKKTGSREVKMPKSKKEKMTIHIETSPLDQVKIAGRVRFEATVPQGIKPWSGAGTHGGDKKQKAKRTRRQVRQQLKQDDQAD